jgi:hypothetical protein
MEVRADDEGMTILLVILSLGVFFALAALYGADSRPVERDRHRPNWR